MNVKTEIVNYKYEYDNGIVFNEKFTKPNNDLLLKWWKEFSSFDVHDYDYFLVGGFINKENTKDIDIVVNGEVNKKLSLVLSLAKQLGVKDNLLIDMFWCNTFYDHKNYSPQKRIRNFNEVKITKNNNTNVYNYGGVKIADNLFASYYDQPYIDYNKSENYKNKYIKIQDYINGTIT